MAEPLDHQAADRSILISFGKPEPEAFIKVGDRARGRRPPACANRRSAPVLRATSYSSSISPTTSSSRSSTVMIPAAPPYSSTTTAMLSPVRCSATRISSSGVDFGKVADRAHHLAHRAAEIGRLEQIEDVDHADDIEDAIVEHRQAGEALAADHLDRVGERRLVGDRVDPHQRHHRLARLGTGEAEDAADHLALGGQNRVALGARDRRPWRCSSRARSSRVRKTLCTSGETPAMPPDARGSAGLDAKQRRERGREHAQRPRREAREGQRALERQQLGHRFAEHQRQRRQNERREESDAGADRMQEAGQRPRPRSRWPDWCWSASTRAAGRAAASRPSAVARSCRRARSRADLELDRPSTSAISLAAKNACTARQRRRSRSPVRRGSSLEPHQLRRVAPRTRSTVASKSPSRKRSPRRGTRPSLRSTSAVERLLAPSAGGFSVPPSSSPEPAQLDRARDQPFARARRAHLGTLEIEFVADLAEQLLEQILQRDQPEQLARTR